MNSTLIASVVFVCGFGSAVLGMLISRWLPDNHLNADSKDIVKLAMGLIATMVALVLGLLTASAKSTFDTASNEVQAAAANIVKLDRALAEYGPEAQTLRTGLHEIIVARVNRMWPQDGSPGVAEMKQLPRAGEGLEARIRRLGAQTDEQRELRASALQIAHDLLATRWLLAVQESTPIPVAFLVVLVFWLSILFGSFGVFAPHNGTVVAALFLCALSVAGSTFLILEMDRPLDGFIKVSGAPLRFAISELGQ